jgi:hypothetical protein
MHMLDDWCSMGTLQIRSHNFGEFEYYQVFWLCLVAPGFEYRTSHPKLEKRKVECLTSNMVCGSSRGCVIKYSL